MEFVIVGALLIGLSLGLFGSGGSILTVPVLVYLLQHGEKVAIAESLGIVGGIALISMIPYWHAGLVNWRLVLLFGVPGMLGTFGGAWLAEFVSGAVQLLLFALVMLLAAGSMLRKRGARKPLPAAAPLHDAESAAQLARSGHTPAASPWRVPATPKAKSVPLVMSEGLGVGAVTGLVGVGGGFLIVPALVLLAKQSMRAAVGTSLVIIFLKSAIGFATYVQSLGTVGLHVNWSTIGWFILLGAVGSLAGSQLGKRIRQQALQRGFAVFLVVMGLAILANQLHTLWLAT